MNEEKLLGEFKEQFNFKRQIIINLIKEKYSIFPIISSISVAALALFSLNPELINNFIFFKFSLILFIILIPISILFHLLTLNYETCEVVKSMLEPDMLLKDNKELEKAFEKMKKETTLTGLKEEMIKGLKTKRLERI